MNQLQYHTQPLTITDARPPFFNPFAPHQAPGSAAVPSPTAAPGAIECGEPITFKRDTSSNIHGDLCASSRPIAASDVETCFASPVAATGSPSDCVMRSCGTGDSGGLLGLLRILLMLDFLSAVKPNSQNGGLGCSDGSGGLLGMLGLMGPKEASDQFQGRASAGGLGGLLEALGLMSLFGVEDPRSQGHGGALLAAEAADKSRSAPVAAQGAPASANSAAASASASTTAAATPNATQAAAPTGGPSSAQPLGPWGTQGGMADYKRQLNACMDREGIKDSSKRSFIHAMAMMEDKDRWARDASKDGSDSANGPLNINPKVLQMAGEKASAKELAPRMPNMSLQEAVSHISKAYDNEGPEKLKRAQRGGETTYNDGTSYKYDVYSRNFDFTHKKIVSTPDLMTNDSRVWTTTPWVGDGDK